MPQSARTGGLLPAVEHIRHPVTQVLMWFCRAVFIFVLAYLSVGQLRAQCVISPPPAPQCPPISSGGVTISTFAASVPVVLDFYGPSSVLINGNSIAGFAFAFTFQPQLVACNGACSNPYPPGPSSINAQISFTATASPFFYGFFNIGNAGAGCPINWQSLGPDPTLIGLTLNTGNATATSISDCANPFSTFPPPSNISAFPGGNVNINLSVNAYPIVPAGSQALVESVSRVGMFFENASPNSGLSITTLSLQSGTVGSSYTQTLTASGGTPPYAWSIPSGTLPPGLSLAGSTIFGTPTLPGISNFTVQVTDSVGGTASLPLGIQVANIPAPTNLQASQVLCDLVNGCLGTQIQLTWNYPAGASIDGFDFDRQTPSDRINGNAWPTTSVPVPLNCTSTASGLTCSYIDTAPPFGTYNYRVRAYKGVDQSDNSNEDAAFQLQLSTLHNNWQMLALFQPDSTANLRQVANLFGYDHFNWLSVMRYAPPSLAHSSRFEDVNGVPLNPPPPPIIDPPLGGWIYLAADNLPYFWNEQTGFDPIYLLANHMAPSANSVKLDFNDFPTLPPYTTAADHYEFETLLVGVLSGAGNPPQFQPLASFYWSTNLKQNGSGGVTDFTTFNLTSPSSLGTGGIFNAQVVPPASFSADVRQLLISTGALGVSPLPNPDTNAPSTAAFIAGKQGSNGWFESPVTVTLIATDIDGPADVKQITYSVAGAETISNAVVLGGSASLTVNTDGISSLTSFSTDSAGNTEIAKTVTLKLDQTPPAITAVRTPPLNANASNNTPVTVSFQCSDNMSGLAAGSPPAPTILSTQGAGQSVSGDCQDLAGNSSTATVGGINIDETPPTIAITSPANGATYSANQGINAAYACTDSLSGLASCVGTVPSGSKIDTTPSGTTTTKTFTVNATDLAGNPASQLVSYRVSCHDVALAISPSTGSRGSIVKVTGTIKSCMNAAQTVSVKFTLTGPLGPKSCANTSTVMFTTPPFTIQAGTSKSVSFPFFIPTSACAGPFTITTTTLVAGTPVDSTSATLTVQ